MKLDSGNWRNYKILFPIHFQLVYGPDTIFFAYNTKNIFQTDLFLEHLDDPKMSQGPLDKLVRPSEVHQFI